MTAAPLSTSYPSAPTPAVQKAALAAASSQHARTNLIRLVKSLEAKAVDNDYDESSVVLKKEWELSVARIIHVIGLICLQTVLYARALLDRLQYVNEQSSSSTAAFQDIDRSLRTVETVFRRRLMSPSPTPSFNPALIALPMSPSSSNQTNPSPVDKASRTSNDHYEESRTAPSPRTQPTTVRSVRRRRAQTDDYLAKINREYTTGDHTSLLPLRLEKTQKSYGNSGAGDRDTLLGGVAPESGLGAAQLHEELGGQLADMSHRLKLNAVHFSNSLENEKHLIEDSQDALEKNLASTRTNKEGLSTVSKKSRGTTCMTFGIILMVLLLFMWTYMLIRFT
ncbi:hypothetical protein I350_02753 [Cryptococcus amylolentus CBS 6273]|nr:hypothetical protein I350_02753 [Cryptococcus amylolentus CBS 6273]